MTKTKLYISGSSLDCGKMRLHFTRFSKLENIEIVYDWTNVERVITNKPSYNAASKEIVEKIKDADLLLAVMDVPTRQYRGTFTEIGMALALDKNVILFNNSDNPVFSYMPSSRFETSLHYQNENVTVFTDMKKLIEYLENS